MERTNAVIRKVGKEYCVFSKDGKNLGCSSTREGAQKRLKQVEFFKHKGKSDMSDFHPDMFGKPSQDNVKAVTPLKTGRVQMSQAGTIAGRLSKRILDTREHFPIENENQAQSAVHRVSNLRQVPAWYSGTVNTLQKEVFLGVAARYPNIRIPVDLKLEAAMANMTEAVDKVTRSKAAKTKTREDVRSGLEGALEVLARKVGDTEPSGADKKVPEVSIQNPEVNPSKVPGVPRQSLSVLFSRANIEDRHTIATTLMDLIEQKQKSLKDAAKVAKRLGAKGLTGDEFKDIMLYLQEELLHELLRKGTTGSSEAVRQVARNRRKS